MMKYLAFINKDGLISDLKMEQLLLANSTWLQVDLQNSESILKYYCS